MKRLGVIIAFTVTLGGCTHHKTDTSHKQLVGNMSKDQTFPKDSIDKYGLSDCGTPLHNELFSSFKKSLDSAWRILLANDKPNDLSVIHSKDKFKEALIANDFVIDSSSNWIKATKRAFNERWRADWYKDSNFVELVLTRWYNGYTYRFMIGSDKFNR